ERWQHVQALHDETAWEDAQALFALVEPEWTGDGGAGLLRQVGSAARSNSGSRSAPGRVG
ncbi:MAG: hypothetical protein ACT4QD_09415, partial [Acidobacteriota bacterium]